MIILEFFIETSELPFFLAVAAQAKAPREPNGRPSTAPLGIALTVEVL